MQIMERPERMETEVTETKLRTMTSELSLLSQSDGSCSFCQGDSAIIAAVYGPTEVRANRERLDRAYIDVVYKPKVGLPGCVERAEEKLIKNSCESAILAMLHPRTSINIILQELQNSGSLLACCINAACLALLDAAVQLKYTIASVTAILYESGEILLDPTAKQLKEAVATFTFVFDSNHKQVLSCNSTGSYSDEQFQTCLLTCQEASHEIFSFYKEAMKVKLSRET